MRAVLHGWEIDVVTGALSSDRPLPIAPTVSILDSDDVGVTIKVPGVPVAPIALCVRALVEIAHRL